jgi:hypothetical protein
MAVIGKMMTTTCWNQSGRECWAVGWLIVNGVTAEKMTKGRTSWLDERVDEWTGG